jgi:hypothetical protein
VELNHRSQACEVLTGTGIRVAKNKMVEHEGIAPSTSAWKAGMYLSTPMLVGIPCWNCTSLCGFANRRLNRSANGMRN